jgi:hypothetical protein
MKQAVVITGANVTVIAYVENCVIIFFHRGSLHLCTRLLRRKHILIEFLVPVDLVWLSMLIWPIETCRVLSIGKHLTDAFLVQNILKQIAAFTKLL